MVRSVGGQDERKADTVSSDSTISPGGEVVYERLTSQNSELRRRIDELERELARAGERFMWLQEIGASLADFGHPDELVADLVDRIPAAMDAERAALFMMEDDDIHLYTRVPVDGVMREIRLERGEGIAGWVAERGRSINVKDAYRDPRFSPRYDQMYGFRTRSVLCQPMRNKDGRIVGVLQVLNRPGGWFGVDDERMLAAITNVVVIVLENKRLFLQTVDRNMELEQTQRQLEDRMRRIDTLYDLQRRINEADDLEEVVHAIALGIVTAVPSNGVAITLIEGPRLTEYAFQRRTDTGDYEEGARTWDASARDEVLESGASVVCNGVVDCFISAGVRGNAPDELSLHSVCAVPLLVDDQCIGAIELINRRNRDSDGRRGFSSADEKTLSLVAAQIGTVVYRTMTRRRQQYEQRLSAIGQMLSGVVHDLKTPLTIASGYLQLMQRADDAERRSEFAERIRAQFEHMHGMTTELLAYARGDSRLYARTVHMHVFVDEVRELLEHEFRDTGIKLDVSTEYRGDARFDDGKLKRVLFNLARNARQAMRDQGGSYVVRFARDGEKLVIQCVDDGPGVPEAIRGRLFEAFVTGDSDGGTGLGLAIVRKLVSEHGGTVSFTSETGQGTTFDIRLPLEVDTSGRDATDGAAATARLPSSG